VNGRAIALSVLMLVLGVSGAAAQSAPPTPPKWSFGAFAYLYIPPDDTNYLQPTVTADRGALHLEARFNYEDRDTGSVWAGVNFSGGDTVAWELTPMAGAVFGSTDGIAPGYKGSVGWRALELYSEGEVVFDAGDSADSFFYNWSELTVAPVDWLRVGLVTQRTRVYQSDREIQRGLLVGASFRRMEVTAYVFNPDDSKPIVVLAFGASF
jgi:hypothetical protein